jgi:hypothetical protein
MSDRGSGYQKGRLTLSSIKNLSSLLGFSVAFAIGAASSGHTQQTIRIGATMSQTGTLATQGVPASNGYFLHSFLSC